jgi:hypothetical protein
MTAETRLAIGVKVSLRKRNVGRFRRRLSRIRSISSS